MDDDAPTREDDARPEAGHLPRRADRRVDRRGVLRAAGWTGAAALAGGLASCTSSSAPAPGADPSADPTASPSVVTKTVAASTAPPPSPTVTPTPTSTPTPSAPKPRPTYATLSKQLSGRLAQRGQRGYQPSALLYNPRFENQSPPQAIAACRSAADVAACVRFAADGGASLRIRNGGHSYGGWSSGPGLVADLAAMNGVRVDRSAMTATIGAGARLIEVYAALAAQGVSIGSGSCGTVGISGLTLGGGVGLLSRQYGLTCDQVASAGVVTANGAVQTVNAKQHPDLFWAIRGGGGSLAAVTSWTFRVRPAPSMQVASLKWDAENAEQVVAAWQAWIVTTPRQLMSACRIFIDGDDIAPGVIVWWNGSGSPTTQLSRLLRDLPRPSSSSPGSPESYGTEMRYAAGCDPSMSAQQCVSYLLAPQQRAASAAASSILRKPLPTKGISALVDAVRSGVGLPNLSGGGVQFDSLGGAVSDVGAGDTAFPWRDAIADIQYTASWPYSSATTGVSGYDAFVQRERAALTPYLGNSGYANYADPSLTDYATDYWGANLSRLKQVKKTYDPHGVFSWPQSVPL